MHPENSICCYLYKLPEYLSLAYRFHLHIFAYQALLSVSLPTKRETRFLLRQNRSQSSYSGQHWLSAVAKARSQRTLSLGLELSPASGGRVRTQNACVFPQLMSLGSAAASPENLVPSPALQRQCATQCVAIENALHLLE